MSELVRGVGYDVMLPDGHVISDDRARLDMAFVHEMLAGAPWAIGRPTALTDRSWANCLCFGVHAPDGRPAGCARVLTDSTFRAHLADLVIRPTSRRRGLGIALVTAILAHPELATVTRWTLATADAHQLYARFGFRSGASDADWMTLERTAASTVASAGI